MELHRTVLVFDLAGRAVAVDATAVHRIVPMAQLAHPPGLPAVLEGVLNLAETPVPVLRLERLLDLPAPEPGLYAALIVLREPEGGLLALLVERIVEVRRTPVSALVPAAPGDSLNGCVEGTIAGDGRNVHLLSTARILMEKERRILSGVQAALASRAAAWEVRP